MSKDKNEGLVGLRNLGNTCFMNSIIQCLSNSVGLREFFLSNDWERELNVKNKLGSGGKIARSFSSLMREMWEGSVETDVISPIELKRSVSSFIDRFEGFRQHDSQEFLLFVLDGIHEDLNRVKERPKYEEFGDYDDEEDIVVYGLSWNFWLKRNRSIIVDLFSGQLKSELVCDVCKFVGVKFDPYMFLSVPVREVKEVSLEDCLSEFISEDKLDDENRWYCKRCKKHVNASKKIGLYNLPPVLIIHLKRFSKNSRGRYSKNKCFVKFDVKELDMRRFLSKDVVDTGVSTVYELYGVSNHHGGVGGGHYTAYCKNSIDNNWYLFNDSRYSKVSEDEVCSRDGYVLFFNRME